MENLDFNKLEEAFSNRGCSTNIDLIRQLLYDFSYSDLSIDTRYKTDEIDEIRKGVFNFLYSGAFERDLNDRTKKYFKEITENHLIDKLKEAQESDDSDKENKVKTIKKELNNLQSWDDFYSKFQNNWNILSNFHRTEYIEKLNGEISHFVIYEAPPICQKKENIKNKYFLISNTGSYATTIRNSFNAEKTVNVCSFMAEKNIGYFDLIMAPMPISSDIRKKWSTDCKWQIGGKQLPVVLFELGIVHLLLHDKSIKEPMFAIGTPALTSTSIFEHYSDKLLKVWRKKESTPPQVCDILFDEPDSLNKNDFILLFTSNLSITNSQTTHKIRGEEGRGIIFPLFKSNVISGSNFLSELLMKNAFDFY